MTDATAATTATATAATAATAEPAAVASRPDHQLPDPAGLAVHHIAVQTADLDASIAWYEAFFGAAVQWTQETYSELSMERLPGLSGLAEVLAGGLRFHLFTRGAEHSAPPERDTNQFQHVCVEVDGPRALQAWHTRWFEVFESGAHRFARPEPATAIVSDADGGQSFYAFDVNGVEFEFTCQPVG